MSADCLRDLLNAARAWLEKQPGMVPWAKGCAMLVGVLNGWLKEYSTPVCDLPVVPGHAHYQDYAARVWRCLEYHWKQAMELTPGGRADVREVAERLWGELGYRGGKRLGGNPLRDVVLAEAVQKRENRAVEAFQKQYKGYAVAQGINVKAAVKSEPEAFWQDLLIKLTGSMKPPGALSKYQGRCGLQNWLGTVARRFALDWRGPSGGPKPVQSCEPWSNHPAPSGPPDCVLVAQDAVARVLRVVSAWSPEDQTIFHLRFGEGLLQKEVAAVIGRHPGNVGRRETWMRQELSRVLPDLGKEYGDE
jgi:DNA-directed RNA polymerase specialized sigma24 family protein